MCARDGRTVRINFSSVEEALPLRGSSTVRRPRTLLDTDQDQNQNQVLDQNSQKITGTQDQTKQVFSLLNSRVNSVPRMQPSDVNGLTRTKCSPESDFWLRHMDVESLCDSTESLMNVWSLKASGSD